VTGVEHVPWRQGEKWQDLTDKFRALRTIDGLSDEFYYFEDDYYVIDPVDDLPHYVLPWSFASRVGTTGFGLSHANTLPLLESAGFEDPPSFEHHVPTVVEKALIPTHLDPGGVPLRYKTMSGVHSPRVPVPLVRDVKVRKNADLKDVLTKQVGFLSSAPNSFESSGVERLLRSRFPNPSPYEKD
jgi:hypothetical protein